MSYEDYSYRRESYNEGRSPDQPIRNFKPGRRSRRRPETLPAEALQPTDEDLVDNDELLPLWIMKITQPALRQAVDYLLARAPESAGLLLGPADDDLLITHFVPDRTGRGTAASFELDTDNLNDVLKRVKPAGINCKGIAHSHPAGICSPSHGDLVYLRRVFALPMNADAAQFYMPIVCGGRLYPYVYAQGRVWHADLVLV